MIASGRASTSPPGALQGRRAQLGARGVALFIAVVLAVVWVNLRLNEGALSGVQRTDQEHSHFAKQLQAKTSNGASHSDPQPHDGLGEGIGIDHKREGALEAQLDQDVSQVPVASIQIPKVDGRVSQVRIDSDAIRASYVCFEHVKNTIVVFTDHDSDVEPLLAKTNVARNYRMHVKWRREPADRWEDFVKQANGLIHRKNTLYLSDGEKPAHCLHDFLFSAYLMHPDGLRFDQYISKSFPGRGCNPDHSWCCFVFERAGIIRSNQYVGFHTPVTCFSRLTHLIFGRGRFAPDWATIPQNAIDFRNLYDDSKGKFGLQNLVNLHNKLLNYDAQITLSRTQQKKKTRTNILVLDRLEATRRVWKNAQEFTVMLIQRWNELSSEPLGNVVYYGASFGELTPLDQARLFYKADVIFSPHGAQLSNLIFGDSKRTCVVETMCSDQPGEPKLLPALAAGELSWFGTFPARLGMRAFTFFSYNENCYHFGKGFTVDLDILFGHLKRSDIFKETVG